MLPRICSKKHSLSTPNPRIPETGTTHPSTIQQRYWPRSNFDACCLVRRQARNGMLWCSSLEFLVQARLRQFCRAASFHNTTAWCLKVNCRICRPLKSKSNTDSESPLNHLTASASSPTPATSKQLEESRLAATKKWLETINANMMRMSEDDGYRREIAKNLS
jgi:hypothetical protein